MEGEGLKRYVRGVVGPFALGQGQRLASKPSLRVMERLWMEPEETRWNLLLLRSKWDILD